MMKRKVIGGIAAMGLGVALAVGGVTAPASALTWTQYCRDHVYDGVPYDTYLSKTAQCRIQAGPAASGGPEYKYNGAVDGVMGTNSWKGLQSMLKRHWGYTGPVDGVPGANTYKAMQRWAATYGYAGPIDGVMGANSWSYFNRAVRVSYFGL